MHKGNLTNQLDTLSKHHYSLQGMQFMMTRLQRYVSKLTRDSRWKNSIAVKDM